MELLTPLLLVLAALLALQMYLTAAVATILFLAASHLLEAAAVEALRLEVVQLLLVLLAVLVAVVLAQQVALKQRQEQEQAVKAITAVKASHRAFMVLAAAAVHLLSAQRVKILVQARAVRGLQTH